VVGLASNTGVANDIFYSGTKHFFATASIAQEI